MTDKQINIVEILAERCKECTLYEGDTISLNISMFDRPLEGICFNNNIYFSADELNYIMQKLISKEQECEELRIDIKDIANLLDLDTVEEYSFSNIELEIKELKQQLDQLKAENDTLRQFLSKEPLALQALQSGYASYKKSSDVFYEMVKQYKQTLTEIKEIAEKRNYLDYSECLDDILQKISEVV